MVTDYTAVCTQLQHVVNATIYNVTSGSNIIFNSRRRNCDQLSNDTYILSHQNHHTRELEVVSEQQGNKFIIPNIQLDTSGVYCAYKQCVPEDMEQCCIRIIG